MKPCELCYFPDLLVVDSIFKQYYASWCFLFIVRALLVSISHVNYVLAHLIACSSDCRFYVVQLPFRMWISCPFDARRKQRLDSTLVWDASRFPLTPSQIPVLDFFGSTPRVLPFSRSNAASPDDHEPTARTEGSEIGTSDLDTGHASLDEGSLKSNAASPDEPEPAIGTYNSDSGHTSLDASNASLYSSSRRHDPGRSGNNTPDTPNMNSVDHSTATSLDSRSISHKQVGSQKEAGNVGWHPRQQQLDIGLLGVTAAVVCVIWCLPWPGAVKADVAMRRLTS